MTTRSFVDPELLWLLDMFPPSDLSAETLTDIRAMLLDRGPEPVAITGERRFARGADGHEVPMLVYRPSGSAGGVLPAILHIHGGGYVAGAPESSEIGNRRLADLLGCVVVSVDYRLAPEHPHPAPIEDCYAALAWMHGEAEGLGIDTARIAVMGESAGGGLAAALALLARDRGEYALAYQLLVYPMLDDRTCTQGPGNGHVGEFIWTNISNRFGWGSLLGREPGGADAPAYAAAARHEDLAGLPSTFLAIGGLDLFLEENLDYAQRLMRAGVPVELHVYPGAFHAFPLAEQARVARQFQRDVEAALGRALKP